MPISPIIKRSGSFLFELIDFYDIYSHVPVSAPRLGRCKINNINRSIGAVTVQSTHNLIVQSFPVRQLKLNLKTIDKLKPSDLKVICCLALNVNGFSGSTAATSNGYVITTSENTTMELKLTKPDISIKISKDGVPMETSNIGLIISYLIKNGYDLYDLIAKGYAISTNQINLI